MSALAQRLRDRISEPLLLKRAERTAQEYAPAQADRIRALAMAASARRAAAAELRDERRAPAALALYGEAIALATSARLAALGQHERPALSRAEAYLELEALAERGEVGDCVQELATSRPLLASDDALAPDALSSDAREGVRAACEVLLDRLACGYEPRSVRELRVARWVRVVGASVALATALCASVAAAVRVENVARDRPARASSQRPGTPDAAGVVDGVRHGSFGVHTRTEATPPWVSVDLERPYRLREVVIYHRGDGYWEESLPVALEISDDATSWLEVARSSGTFTDQQPLRVRLKDEVARHVRVIKLTPGYLALGEIEVFGERP